MTGAARRELNPWWAAAAIAGTSANPGSFTIVGYWPPCGEPSPRAAITPPGATRREDLTSLHRRRGRHWTLGGWGTSALTRWMAANVAVAQDPAGNLKPAKDKSTERIDGIVALIMAIGRAMVAQEEPEPEYSLHFV
jgi:hypothetical protein